MKAKNWRTQNSKARPLFFHWWWIEKEIIYYSSHSDIGRFMVSQEDMAPLPGRLSYPKCSTKGQYETCLQKRMDGAQHGHGFEWNCAPCHNTTNLLYDANVQVYRDYTLYTAYKCVCYMCFYESICICVLCLCVCPSHQHNSCSQRSRLLTHPFELVQWPHQEHCATHKSVFNTLYIMHPCDIDAINYVYIAHCVVVNKSVWSNICFIL